ncbi:hypothetical protein K2X33_09870 [bacterium]|nr:hypothetical protein [bacterium]
MQLKKHHKVVVVLTVLFALAWALWTFIMLPASETPSFPNPAETPPGETPPPNPAH